MPFIHIEWLEGRTQEAKAALAHDIIEVVAKHSGAPKEKIHVIFEEIKKDNLFQETTN